MLSCVVGYIKFAKAKEVFWENNMILSIVGPIKANVKLQKGSRY